MTFDKTLIFGFLAGAVAGVVGAKFITEHKEEIGAKLKNLKSGSPFAKNDEGSDSEMTLEELETQKERLEDLIADLKSKQQ